MRSLLGPKWKRLRCSCFWDWFVGCHIHSSSRPQESLLVLTVEGRLLRQDLGCIVRSLHRAEFPVLDPAAAEGEARVFPEALCDDVPRR